MTEKPVTRKWVLHVVCDLLLFIIAGRDEGTDYIEAARKELWKLEDADE